ncbi:MAG: LON peptidase substrate-binding domain-containing protein [Pseudomonadales bacterium]|nr:LON peptidase substrate-binding domain-containing protein [Pseudomonadales bacterium]
MAEIPLFPLPLVLFPGGRLSLQIFETRYLDMVMRCMRGDSGFGVVMIEEGRQVLENSERSLPSVSHQGVYCKIINFDQLPTGMLGIMIEGQTKFVIRDQYEQPDRLMMADVEFLETEEPHEVPDEFEHLVRILQSFVEHQDVVSLGYTVDFNSAVEVGARLTELLPCADETKQLLLELRNPLARLKELGKVVAEMQGQLSS